MFTSARERGTRLMSSGWMWCRLHQTFFAHIKSFHVKEFPLLGSIRERKFADIGVEVLVCHNQVLEESVHGCVELMVPHGHIFDAYTETMP
jgi:hypothetical protein